jgi:plastocyanin
MPTKRTLIACLALLALASGGCGGDDEPSGAGSSSSTTGSQATGGGSAEAKATVDIKDFKFVPEAVKVKAGGAVTFANSDKAKHNAQTDNSADGAFNTDDLQKGESKAVTFEEPGTYAYYCVYHRFMTGTVEVSE